MLRVELVSEAKGTLVIDGVDPGGLNDFNIELKRSKDNEGVFFEFSVNLDFNKASRTYIRDVYEVEGIEGVIRVNLYQYLSNAYNFDLIYTGQLKLSNYKIKEISVTTNIENIGFERKFINLLSQDVDPASVLSYDQSTIPALPAVALSCPPKTILKKIDATIENENIFTQNNVISESFGVCVLSCAHDVDQTVYGNINTGDYVSAEINDHFTLPWGISEISPVNMLDVNEAGTADIDISLRLQHSVTEVSTGGDLNVTGCGTDNLGHIEIKAWFKHEDGVGTLKTLAQIGSDWTVPTCPGFTTWESAFETKEYNALGVSLEVGDKIYVYYTLRIFGEYTQGITAGSELTHTVTVEGVKALTFIRLDYQTTFPATTSNSYFVYELLEKICQYLTGQTDCFRSDFFGRTDTVPPYIEDGGGSLLAFTNGKSLRQLSNDTFYTNWQDIFDTLNMLYCLGWGFETLQDGSTIVRIEPKTHFYDKDTQVYDFGSVSNLSKDAAEDRYSAQIEIGYPRMNKIDQVNSTDEFNTLLRLSAPITQAKGKLLLRTKYRASGFEIEAQRRFIGTTEDSQGDDEVYLLGLRRNGGALEVAQAQDYIAVNNVIDPDTSYNLDLAPRRTLENWAEILAVNVIRGTDKVLKNTYGEGNSIMSSQRTGETVALAENSDFDLTTKSALYYPDIYEFEAELSAENYRVIRDNPRGFFSLVDWADNPLTGFLLNLTYTPEENKADVTLLRRNLPVETVTVTPAVWSPSDLGAKLRTALEADKRTNFDIDGDNRISEWLDDLSGNSFNPTSAGSNRPLWDEANKRVSIGAGEFFDFIDMFNDIKNDQQGEVVFIVESKLGDMNVLSAGETAGADFFQLLQFAGFGNVGITGTFSAGEAGQGKVCSIASDGADHFGYINGVLGTVFADNDPGVWFADFAGLDNMFMGQLSRNSTISDLQLYIKALYVIQGTPLTNDERVNLVDYANTKFSL